MNKQITAAAQKRLQQLLTNLGAARAAAQQLAAQPPEAPPPPALLDGLAQQDAELAQRASAWLDAEKVRVNRIASGQARTVDLFTRAEATLKALASR
jgi:hypothetical protein